MSTVETLQLVLQQFHIYFGLPILILGVIGGILNIIIFTTLKTFRETTCGFCLTTVSVVNISQLLTALLVRILSEGFHTDIRKIPWVCKFQVYISVWGVSVSLLGMCLVTIDQFFSMSKYREFSSLRIVHRCIFIICICSGMYCICLLVYWGAPFGTCMIINPNFAIFSSRVQFPVLYGLPLITMIIFSILTFYNVRALINRQVNIVRLNRDRQLTGMTLVHVLFVVITMLPYVLFFIIYAQNQYSTDPIQVARYNLIYGILVLIASSNCSVSFSF
jgi:hypothetical protein